jgi:hypothetical protein
MGLNRLDADTRVGHKNIHLVFVSICDPSKRNLNVAIKRRYCDEHVWVSHEGVQAHQVMKLPLPLSVAEWNLAGEELERRVHLRNESIARRSWIQFRFAKFVRQILILEELFANVPCLWACLNRTCE